MANGKVKYNYPNINAINKNGVLALKQAADATLTDIIQAQVIPFDYGTMQNDQTFVDYSESAQGKVYIVTSAPQATRLYFHPEYNFQTANNPGAKAAWFEEWIDGAFLKKAFAQRYRALNGGVK
jgi:antitoxin component of RelBE/YafQ-DinJ toxin-antitoxin module